MFGQIPLAPREGIIGESHVGPDEHIVFEPDAVPQLHTALDGDTITDNDVILYEYVIAHITVRTDYRTRQDVGEGPDTRRAADGFTLDQCLRMLEYLGHRPRPLCAPLPP